MPGGATSARPSGRRMPWPPVSLPRPMVPPRGGAGAGSGFGARVRPRGVRSRLRCTAMHIVGPLVCPVLVGRDDLLALAERRLEQAREGRGHVLFLAGE